MKGVRGGSIPVVLILRGPYCSAARYCCGSRLFWHCPLLRKEVTASYYIWLDLIGEPMSWAEGRAQAPTSGLEVPHQYPLYHII